MSAVTMWSTARPRVLAIAGVLASFLVVSLWVLDFSPRNGIGEERTVFTEIKFSHEPLSWQWTCDKKRLLGKDKVRLCYKKLPEYKARDETMVISDILVSKQQQSGEGWKLIDASTGFWVRYDPYKSSTKPVTAIKLLYGPDAVMPLPGWTLLDALRENESVPPIKTDVDTRIAIRKGHNGPLPSVNLTWSKPKLKILQIADLHMVTGVGECNYPAYFEDCDADIETVRLMNSVLDLEQPDFVVFTGDQLFGPDAFDAETALLKALAPVVTRKIPFATVFGNHDREADLANSDLMQIVAELPYSVASRGPESISGIGNYVLDLQQTGASETSSLRLFFIDSHSMTWNRHAYDYIKQDQLDWAAQQDAGNLSMVFFHIPVPEYEQDSAPESGIRGEGISAPKHNSHALRVFRNLGASVLNVGHDHCNDFCEIDRGLNYDETPVWLCYGGGGGYGGYGCANERVHGGIFERRFRVFEVDSAIGEINTWKRVEHTDEAIDQLNLVKGFELAF